MKLRVYLLATVVLVTSGILISLNGCGGVGSGSGQTPPPPGKIQHVVVIVQENRSIDNLFQDPNLIEAGAHIAQSGIDSHGKTIQLKKVPLVVDYNPGHGHDSFVDMCDLSSSTGQCQMNGADTVPVACEPGAQDCPAPDLTFEYVDPNDVQPYFALAEQYTFADQMFQTNQGPSMPAHQFLLSGTSEPSTGSNLFAAENPLTSGPPDAGCDAPPGSTVTLIDPSGSETSNAPIFPCFEHKTLTDLLEANNNTWRYYTPSAPAIWTAPEAINHICGPQQTPNGVQCQGADWTNHVVLNQKQILTDIASNQLQDVSWVVPTADDSDHAGMDTKGDGPSWVASIVNAIGNSPYWANTAIFITWDDWGGWYDHVAPPKVLVDCAQWGCGYVYGFRVPLIVVSAYAKAGYISPVQHDFGSILKYIEGVFNLPSLGFADAAADDLSDCFNYNQTPLTFQTIPSALKAQDFLNDKTPPRDPDDD
ncbi:MAG: alkaline phosphatase family protein [Terriglobales bacterium]|jgi:phospholipase C